MVRFLAPAIATKTANVSADGLFFVANGPLTVDVELGDGSEKRCVRGRLVRVESKTASSDTLGIAVRLEG